MSLTLQEKAVAAQKIKKGNYQFTTNLNSLNYISNFPIELSTKQNK